MSIRRLLTRTERCCGPWLTRTGLSCGAGFLIMLWVGLLLAEVGHFSAWIALSMAVVAGGFAWRHFRRRLNDCPPSGTTSCGLLAAGALALLSLAFTVPPSEFILGGWDPGVYVHTASVLAQDGTLLPEYPDLAAMDALSRALIGRQGQDAWEPFLGMRMRPDGRISPQFYHLYPVLMALAWPFGGVRAALLVNPLLNALCIVLMYLWACRWMRPRWAFAAALLLALNPAQVWQAGFGTAELLAQCLLFIGLIATDRALSGPSEDRLYPMLAGAAFGLMLLTKYEAMLFVVPFVLVLLTGLRDRAKRAPLTILLGTIAVLGVHVWVHHRFFSTLYYPMGNWVVPGLLAAGLAALAITVFALLKPRRPAAGMSKAVVWGTVLRIAAVAGFVAWIFFAGYIRPRLTVEGSVLSLFTQLYPHGNETHWFAFLAGRNARNFWYLTSLFGVVGLTAALAGVGILMVRTRTVWRTAWLAASLGVLVLLMTQISHEPFMMFVSRRTIPVILPLLCLGVAALCDGCENALGRHVRLGVLVGVLVVVVSLAGTLGRSVYLAQHREWPGLVQWYDQLAEQIPHGAMVYSDQPGFAAPLRFVYGLQAYEVRGFAPDEPADPLPMMMKQAEHNPVFWLTQAALPEAYMDTVTPAATLPLHSVILGTPAHTVPRYIRPRGGAFTLYRIAPPDGPADVRGR